jgi:pyruvate/2-oxoglutarate dehydrogenase complex dihydrolipoamide dehydrogenase (E3) component/uncharacterized membrane protein YdjX (TVP38/TMEM64 family)
VGLVLALAAALALWWSLGPDEASGLSVLKAQHAFLLAWYGESPWQLRAAFFALYVAVALLAVPGISVFTVAGGAVFGLGWGVLLVSFASTVGATLSFWLSRYLLGDWLRARMGPRVLAVRAHVEQEGAFYLLSLRLMPVVPFGLINLLMGLTAMRTRTFYGVSQIGMLASTVVFVSAGQQLGSIQSASEALKPGMLGALLGLGLLVAILPKIGKRVLEWMRQRKLLAPWRSQRPRRFDTNLVVIGAGAGGLVSAYIAAAAQAKVTLVEAKSMGGDCLNYGCVPSKALIQSAKVAYQVRTAAQFGVHSGTSDAPALDWPAVMARIARVIASIAPHDSAERYTALGVDVLQGHAKIINPWTVEVTRPDHSVLRIYTRSIVIAAGAQPVVPDLPGLHEVGFATSDTLWAQLAQCSSLPQRIMVLGGGPIGCELGQAFARLGATVTLVEAGPRLLAREDEDVSALVQSVLQADGVQVLRAHTALRCAGQGKDKTITLRDAASGLEQSMAFDLLVCAVGRRARLSGYGLEALGIATDITIQRTVPTNAYLQTVFPTIYAAGDVAGPYQLTHAAAHQAWYATVNALFGDFKRFAADYRHLPATTFVAPEVARVGLNEQDAQAQGVRYEVTRFDLADLNRALTDVGSTRPLGFVKVLTVPGKDRILGATIVAPQAGEMLAEYVLAMRHGLGLKAILGTVHAYPTFAEANKYAAGAWQRGHAPQRLLDLARVFHAWRRG